ncbi:MAG: glycosyltransferase family 25 protein [Planctomycetaceae bacterium]|jgi:glycosyl transferase family 25|nr:glycosyltransferase family 25 protein [Planctomycetaceae bacterium]
MTNSYSPLNFYILNLDRSPDRWLRCQREYGNLGLNVIRVDAVDGKQIILPHKEYSKWGFRLRCGYDAFPEEIGCFFSHVKALRLFLESDREHAVICEDDTTPLPDLAEVVDEACRYRKYWDLLRLNGIKEPKQYKIVQLNQKYQLCIPFNHYLGSGAYMLNRKAAKKLLQHALPMRVPFDHVLGLNWTMGFSIASVKPYPIQLNDCSVVSTIRLKPFPKLTWQKFHVNPYRVTIRMGRYCGQFLSACKRSVVPIRPETFHQDVKQKIRLEDCPLRNSEDQKEG